jgi:hypothetical protein
VSEPITDVKIVDNVFVKLHHFLRVGDGVDDVASPDITAEQAFELTTKYSLATDPV